MNEWDLRKQQVSDAASWLNDLYQRRVGQPFLSGMNAIQEGQQALSRSASKGISGFLGTEFGANTPEYNRGADVAKATDAVSAAALPAIGMPPVPIAKGVGMLAKAIGEIPGAVESLGLIPATIWNARLVKDSDRLKNLTVQYRNMRDPAEKEKFLADLWDKERISLNPVSEEFGIVPRGAAESAVNPKGKNVREALNWPELWSLYPDDIGTATKIRQTTKKRLGGAQGAFDPEKSTLYLAKDADAGAEHVLRHETTHDLHKYDTQGGNPTQIQKEFLNKPLTALEQAARDMHTADADQFFRAVDGNAKELVDEYGIPKEEYFDFADDFVEFVRSTNPNAREDTIRAAFDQYLNRVGSGKGPVTERELVEIQKRGRSTLSGISEFYKRQGVHNSKNPAFDIYQNLGGEALAEFSPWYTEMLRADPTLADTDPRLLFGMFKKQEGYPQQTPNWNQTFQNYNDTLGGMFPLDPEFKAMRTPLGWGREPPKLKNRGKME